MLTSEQIRVALLDRNVSEVSRRSGVSMETLKNIKRPGHNPRESTLKTLTDYLTTPLWERESKAE